MENKLTKEYAEKMARQNFIYGEIMGNYVFGYMKAIEETNAKELLEALTEAMQYVDSTFFPELKNKCINAINKATR